MSLSPKQIDKILMRHYGSKRVIARESGVTACAVTNVLRGRAASLRIMVIAERIALQFLELERQGRKTTQRAERRQAEAVQAKSA